MWNLVNKKKTKEEIEERRKSAEEKHKEYKNRGVAGRQRNK